MTSILEASQPIVLSDLTMDQTFRTTMLAVVRGLPILGDGSPEGVVEALQFQLYTDRTSTTPGTIDYRKMLPDIGGNRTLGWILI